MIFIPSPNVAEDHQTKNAEALSLKNAAVVIKESDLDVDFENKFSQLLNTKEKREQLSQNIKKFVMVNATKDIVDQVELLLKK